jgi:hypothetical protein
LPSWCERTFDWKFQFSKNRGNCLSTWPQIKEYLKKIIFQ